MVDDKGEKKMYKKKICRYDECRDVGCKRLRTQKKEKKKKNTLTWSASEYDLCKILGVRNV